MFAGLLDDPLTMTISFLEVKNEHTHLKVFPLMPRAESFCSTLSWGTELKAYEKSRYIYITFATR